MPEYSGSEKAMVSSQSNMTNPAGETSLGRAREKNEAIQESVEQSAQELLVINTVLKQELPDHVQADDVAQALEKSGALEERIQESADDLAEVNQQLQQEIGEREELERELAETKAALAEATGDPQKR
jgi:C4-dicarboxylate-specific signal transduction histidine kinase